MPNQNLFSEIERLHNIKKDAHILDYGCNEGYMLVNLYNLGYRNLHAYDVNPSLLSSTAKSVSKWYEAQGHSDEKKFDIIIIAKVLCCVADGEERKKLVANLKKKLKSDGLLIIEEYNLLGKIRSILLNLIKMTLTRRHFLQCRTEWVADDFYDIKFANSCLFTQNYKNTSLHQWLFPVWPNTSIYLFFNAGYSTNS